MDGVGGSDLASEGRLVELDVLDKFVVVFWFLVKLFTVLLSLLWCFGFWLSCLPCCLKELAACSFDGMPVHFL